MKISKKKHVKNNEVNKICSFFFKKKFSIKFYIYAIADPKVLTTARLSVDALISNTCHHR